MNRDKAPFDLQNVEYSFALNANFHDEHGSGQVNLQNEPSNIYCSGFKNGYKVVGHKFDINADRTYFFLVNPDTGCSEIGYIDSLSNIGGLSQVESNCGCNISVMLETPLEEQTQTAICPYHEIISDFCKLTQECTGCLNFNINYPIFESNIHIKDEKTGKVLYWTDNLNPPRYLQLDYLEEYTNIVDPCSGETVEVCLDCDKMRIFPLFDKPCMRVEIIENGGNLRAGTYEALIAYSTLKGNELTGYYSLTNPTPIFDPNNYILDQTNLDYLTNQSIKLRLTNLDQDYEYYKIAIVYRSGLDGAVVVKAYGVFPIDNETVSISSLVDKPAMDLLDVLNRRPSYDRARGMAQGNGYLFQYGMETHREVNLQPVVSLMGGFVRWATIQAEEDLYENGEHVSNYTGYMRDEVIPLSVRFFFRGGYETANFVFIARPATDYELQELGAGFTADNNTNSVLANGANCASDTRNKRWQFENTAEIEDDCPVPEGTGINTVTVVETEEASCFVLDESGDLDVVDTLASGTVTVPSDQDLVTFINQNYADVIAGVFTDGDWPSIVAILTGSYPSFNCTPTFGDNCGTPTLTSEEIIPIETDTESSSTTSIPFADYNNHPQPPSSCNSILGDVSGGGSGPTQDTAFEVVYMRPFEIVYERTAPPSNTACGSAGLLLQFPDPPPAVMLDNPFFLQYDGALGSASSLQTGITITGGGVDTANGYTNRLHTNAQWYKIDFNGLTEIAVELSPAAPGNYTDDICQNSVRISTYTSCSATTDVAGYSDIIADITLVNDPTKLVVLQASDFGGVNGTAYIAVDSPIYCDSLGEITFSGTSGTCDVTIGVNTYTATFAVDIATTVANFITTHAANMLVNNNVILTSGSAPSKVELRSTCAQYTAMTVVNQTGNLAGVKAQLQTYHTLRPPCGCINIFSRIPELAISITFTDLTFGKKQTYESECTYERPILTGCDPVPHQYGKFGYWESVNTYPCNEELFDSSNLIVPVSSIPASEQSDFITYYCDSTTPIIGTNFNLDPNKVNFRDKAIRHYKFPCSIKVPFMSTQGQAPAAFGKSVIYPIGFSISNDIINGLLDAAVSSGLITAQERSDIIKYEIFRGDRTVDKSVIAKGLAFDLYKYEDNGNTIYYPNYPLNSLGTDRFNGNVPHPYGSAFNRQWTFHSPDTSFHKPTLPRELKLEGYQFGRSGTYFDVVRDHPTYVVLGDKAFNLATNLALAEVILDGVLLVLDAFLQAMAAGTTWGIILALVIAIAIIAAIVGGMFKVGGIRYQWIETFRNLGHPYQFAYYSATIGHYSYFVPNTLSTEVLRGIPAISYMRDGRWTIPNEASGSSFDVNNMDRSDSVFFTVGSGYSLFYPALYINYDNADTGTSSRKKYSGVGGSAKLLGNAASPYISLKQYLPGQYGSISALKWIHTGFCGDLSSTNSGCNPIFGGDTYISRFSVKRKLPFFTANSHGLAPLTPFKYSDYFNINPEVEDDRYFMNYLIQDDSDNYFQMYLFPTNRSHYNLDADAGTDFFYIKPPAKFYLFSYGFPYFLVESTVNCNFRYAKRELFENFYPNFGNVIEATQESNVSIREPNTYFYNFVYTSLPTTYPWRMLPVDYDQEKYAGLADLTNTVIYSMQDGTENSLTDPWLLYRALDSYNFPKSFGKLIDMDSIESEQILARFENGVSVFGSIDPIRDKLTPETKNLGSGGIFAGRSVSFNKTDLGYAGTQHKAKVSCEFGHFWVDAKRGQVFNIAPNVQGMTEISMGVEKWFKENLPFKITQYIPGIEQEVLDNSFKGLGITMGWDARLKRVFITKLDYIPLNPSIIVQGRDFYTIDENNNLIKVDLTDPTYFRECSFTIAYSPLAEGWISYYSFKPNYYVTYNNYFQTGVNYSVDASEEGLWSHLSFLTSYQVFYGKLYPFIIESTTPSQMTNSLLKSVEYYMDVRKYYNKYDAADVMNHGFNKAFIYNSQQNSGQLNLIPQIKNDMSQNLQYPKHNTDSIDILQSEMNGKWSFNYFYNMVRNEASGLPVWLYDCNQIDKNLDSRLLDYKNSFKDRLRGDYFIVRLQQDIESRFKMIFRFSIDTRDYYHQ